MTLKNTPTNFSHKFKALQLTFQVVLDTETEDYYIKITQFQSAQDEAFIGVAYRLQVGGSGNILIGGYDPTTHAADAYQALSLILSELFSTNNVIGRDVPEQHIGTEEEDFLQPDTENNHIVYGNGGSDHISGNLAADILSGDAGNDTITGSSGNDSIVGGQGQDYLQGNNGDDFLLGNTENDLLDGAHGDDWLAGEEGDDSLVGWTGDDGIDGGGGNDSLLGGSGDDTLQGSEGDDYLSGYNGNDSLTGDDGADDLRGGEDADTLQGGNGNDVLYGGAGTDILFGDEGNDVLHGDEGADTLNGGSGRDTLIGGAGADHFVFDDAADSVHQNADRIRGFVVSEDKIDLTGLGYTDIVAAHPEEGELRLAYNAASDRTYILDDYSDFEIILEGNYSATLTKEDFIL